MTFGQVSRLARILVLGSVISTNSPLNVGVLHASCFGSRGACFGNFCDYRQDCDCDAYGAGAAVLCLLGV